MPIELSNAVKTTSGWSFASKGMNKIFINKIYTSVVLTCIIIILIMILYPCKKDTPLYILGKLGFYIFISSLSIIFMHDCVIYNKNKSISDDMDNDKFVNAIGETDIVYGGGAVEVKIKNQKQEYDIVENTNNDGDDDPIFAMHGIS
jgi:hypothetical protein